MTRRLLLATWLLLVSNSAAHAWPFLFFFHTSSPGVPSDTVRIDFVSNPPPVASCGNLGGPGIAVHPNPNTNTFYLHSYGWLQKDYAWGGGCAQAAAVQTRNGGLFTTQGMAISPDGATVWITDNAGYVGVHDANTLAEIAYAYLTNNTSGALCVVRMVEVNPANHLEAMVTSSNCNVKKVWPSGGWLYDASVPDSDNSWGVTYSPDGGRVYAIRETDATQDKLLEIDPVKMKRTQAWDILPRSRQVLVANGWVFAPGTGTDNVTKMVAVNPAGGCDSYVTKPNGALTHITAHMDGFSRRGNGLYVLSRDAGVMAEFDSLSRNWTGNNYPVGYGAEAWGPFMPLW